ncbi:MAG: hypothetical protein KQH59_01930 [Desulfobulbaceae bacterium]|nr:hypothetical protein [Desulfobulbaceae bacterium]
MALLTDRDAIISLIDNEINQFLLAPALSDLPMEQLFSLIHSTEYQKLRNRYKWNYVLKAWVLCIGQWKMYNPDFMEGYNTRIKNLDRWEQVVNEYMTLQTSTLYPSSLDKSASQFMRG